jgi:hypothetical protein
MKRNGESDLGLPCELYHQGSAEYQRMIGWKGTVKEQKWRGPLPFSHTRSSQKVRSLSRSVPAKDMHKFPVVE